MIVESKNYYNLKDLLSGIPKHRGIYTKKYANKRQKNKNWRKRKGLK